MGCNCSKPRPMYSMKESNYICIDCRQVVEPIQSKLPPPDWTPADGFGKKGPEVLKRFSFECPECKCEEVYFSVFLNPVGPSKCEACNYIATGEEIEAIRNKRNLESAARKKIPMLRALESVGKQVAELPEEPEC